MNTTIQTAETHRTRDYLITGGLVPLFENRHRLKLRAETSRLLEEIESDYALQLNKILGNYLDNDQNGQFKWNVRYFSAQEVETALGKLVRANRDHRPVIALDDVYCRNVADGHFSVTRLMNPSNLDEGTFIGPRLRRPSLDKQTRDLVKRFGTEIDIMDIGVFEGKTVVELVKNVFPKAGIKVKNAYVLFAAEIGRDRLKLEDINLHAVEHSDWIDWLEVRDCMGLDGRKVNSNPRSSEVHNTFIPYSVRPLGWASIPSGYEQKFRALCLEYFEKVRGVLRVQGIDINLVSLPDSPMVKELRIVGAEQK